MNTTRNLLIAAALAAALTATQAQTFQTNNGVIIGSPGVLPPPRTDGGAIIPSPPGGPTPPMPGRTNLNTHTNMPWNVRSNGNMFPGTNGIQRVPISSNIPRTSIQPPDSSLPPMTNAPGQVIQPGTQPNQSGTIPPRQLDPNNPNTGQHQPVTPANPSAPIAPPVRTK